MIKSSDHALRIIGPALDRQLSSPGRLFIEPNILGLGRLGAVDYLKRKGYEILWMGGV